MSLRAAEPLVLADAFQSVLGTYSSLHGKARQLRNQEPGANLDRLSDMLFDMIGIHLMLHEGDV